MKNRLHAVMRWCRSDIALLAFIWIAGLLAGTFLASGTANISVSLMHAVSFDRVSIVARLSTAVLPFLLAALAVNIQRPKLLLFLCFIKTFCFSLCAQVIFSCFGSAGWLIRTLVLFSDICLVPALCWYCIRHISGSQNSEKQDLSVCLLITALVSSIDYFAVSPLLAKITDI